MRTSKFVVMLVLAVSIACGAGEPAQTQVPKPAVQPVTPATSQAPQPPQVGAALCPCPLPQATAPTVARRPTTRPLRQAVQTVTPPTPQVSIPQQAPAPIINNNLTVTTPPELITLFRELATTRQVTPQPPQDNRVLEELLAETRRHTEQNAAAAIQRDETNRLIRSGNNWNKVGVIANVVGATAEVIQVFQHDKMVDSIDRLGAEVRGMKPIINLSQVATNSNNQTQANQNTSNSSSDSSSSASAEAEGGDGGSGGGGGSSSSNSSSSVPNPPRGGGGRDDHNDGKGDSKPPNHQGPGNNKPDNKPSGGNPKPPQKPTDTKPGNGHGDKNHDHSGPPGQNKK